jgi:hypothetical protein
MAPLQLRIICPEEHDHMMLFAAQRRNLTGLTRASFLCEAVNIDVGSGIKVPFSTADYT